MLASALCRPPSNSCNFFCNCRMKSLLLLSIGLLCIADECMASRSISEDSRESHGRPPSQRDRDGQRKRRRSSRGDSNDLFQKFSKVPKGELVKEAKHLFRYFDDYLDHDPKVWADLKEEHVAVLVARAKELSKGGRRKDDILTEKDMLAILKSRKTSEPCVLIGSSVFEASRVTAEMLQHIDFECYEMILGKFSRSSHHERDRRSHDGDRRERESSRPFKVFYERHGSHLELPEDVIRRYVESHLRMSHLRARSSSSHGESDLQFCGMLGVYSKYMSAKQTSQLGWSCFQSAIEAERRFEKLLRGRDRKSRERSIRRDL